VGRTWVLILAASLVVVHTSLAPAVVSGPAREHVDRGYAWLAQARLETDRATREGRLNEAIAAFREGYQSSANPMTQVQALLGAAQAYLLVQSPRRVFPFLWQATPLQRAARNLQQALVLQPDNAAAALLLGVVYWRQAVSPAPPQDDALVHSRHYLAQAAARGIPIRLSTATAPAEEPGKTFGVEDTILALQYIDARGVGSMDDLVLLYRSATSERVFGTVVTAEQAHPLVREPTTGTLAATGLPEAITLTPRPGSPPVMTIRLRQGSQRTELRFAWDGTHFVSLSAAP